MLSRLRKILTAVSLLLSLATCVVWWRSRTTLENFYFVTNSNVLWDIGFDKSLAITRISDWPGTNNHWHSLGHYNSDSCVIEGLYPLLAEGGVGGASRHQHRLWQFTATSGQLCSLADSVGNIRLCPPEPQGNLLTWRWTRPMAFWAVSAPYGTVAIVVAAPILLVVGSALIAKTRRGLTHTTRYIRLIRHRNNKCVYCGYDLRFSPERCPECGLPKPPATEFRRMEQARQVLLRTWSMICRVVAIVIAPTTLLAAALIAVGFLASWAGVTATDAWHAWPHWHRSNERLILGEDCARIARWTAATCLLFWGQWRRSHSRKSNLIATATAAPEPQNWSQTG